MRSLSQRNNFFPLALAMSFIAILIVFLGMPFNAQALVPIEGVIYGKVTDIRQYDPLRNILTKTYFGTRKDYQSRISIFKGHYANGKRLKASCEKDLSYRYANKEQEIKAKKSILGTLQYIGLDLAIKAIAAYAKKIELDQEAYNRLAQNLVSGTCSTNLTVYSHKRLLNNLKHFWNETDASVLPSIAKSPYFEKNAKDLHNQLGVYKRELDYTLRNFRSLCSWSGDTDDYGMLTPYLKNPFIMSYIFDHLERKRITAVLKTGEIIHETYPKSVQVSCNNLICRKSNKMIFDKLYPRMIGSSRLRDDFEALYCESFSRAKYNTVNPTMRAWIKQQTETEATLEGMNLFALISGVPEFLISTDSFDGSILALKDNIKTKWDRWAQKKSSELEGDILYEEALDVKLVKKTNPYELAKGEFSVLFDMTLGELDKLIPDDNIDAFFSLTFQKSYIKYLQEKIDFYNLKGRYAQIEELKADIALRVGAQLNKRKGIFLTPVWNSKFQEIIAREIYFQVKEYSGSKFNYKDQDKVSIPVRMRFGLFALQYMRKKYTYSLGQLTSK